MKTIEEIGEGCGKMLPAKNRKVLDSFECVKSFLCPNCENVGAQTRDFYSEIEKAFRKCHEDSLFLERQKKIDLAAINNLAQRSGELILLYSKIRKLSYWDSVKSLREKTGVSYG